MPQELSTWPVPRCPLISGPLLAVPLSEPNPGYGSVSLHDIILLATSISGPVVPWPFQPLASSTSGHLDLWPLQPLDTLTSGHFNLWPFDSGNYEHTLPQLLGHFWTTWPLAWMNYWHLWTGLFELWPMQPLDKMNLWTLWCALVVPVSGKIWPSASDVREVGSFCQKMS